MSYSATVAADSATAHANRLITMEVTFPGVCSNGLALFYVNGAEESEHVLTPADTPEIAHHKKKCNKGRGVGS